PPRLLTPALVLADLHAVGRQRTLDEEPLAREPLILALEAVDLPSIQRGDVHRLALLEHVLLQLLPVVVALEQYATHERIEIRLRQWRNRASAHNGRCNRDEQPAHLRLNTMP